MMEIADLKNWEQPIKGIYSYKISDEIRLEIHIINSYEDEESFCTAKLYMFEINKDVHGIRYFTREALTNRTAIETCLAMAYKQYERLAGLRRRKS